MYNLFITFLLVDIKVISAALNDTQMMVIGEYDVATAYFSVDLEGLGESCHDDRCRSDYYNSRI
jgi:hypothetical protein